MHRRCGRGFDATQIGHSEEPQEIPMDQVQRDVSGGRMDQEPE